MYENCLTVSSKIYDTQSLSKSQQLNDLQTPWITKGVENLSKK